LADLVEDVLECVDVGRAEAAAEVAGGGGVGNAAGTEGVEEVAVVATQLDVLQAGALAEGVVDEVENVIGLVLGQMNLEQVELSVDGVEESQVAGEGMDGCEAAVGDSVGAVADLVVDVRGGEQRVGAIAALGRVEAAVNLVLGASQLLVYRSVHWKSLRHWGMEKWYLLLLPRKTPRDFVFSGKHPAPKGGTFACSRTSCRACCQATKTARSEKAKNTAG
jgi:hypothetical protein